MPTVKIGLTYNVRSAQSAVPRRRAGRRGGGIRFARNDCNLSRRLSESLGHEVELLGDGLPLFGGCVDGCRPDLVFNFAEGTGVGRSREARVPAVLEMLGIPYTGSDPLTLAVTLDKPCAKQLVRGGRGWRRPIGSSSMAIWPNSTTGSGRCRCR